MFLIDSLTAALLQWTVYITRLIFLSAKKHQKLRQKYGKQEQRNNVFDEKKHRHRRHRIEGRVCVGFFLLFRQSTKFIVTRIGFNFATCFPFHVFFCLFCVLFELSNKAARPEFTTTFLWLSKWFETLYLFFLSLSHSKTSAITGIATAVKREDKTDICLRQRNCYLRHGLRWNWSTRKCRQ